MFFDLLLCLFRTIFFYCDSDLINIAINENKSEVRLLSILMKFYIVIIIKLHNTSLPYYDIEASLHIGLQTGLFVGLRSLRLYTFSNRWARAIWIIRNHWGTRCRPFVRKWFEVRIVTLLPLLFHSGRNLIHQHPQDWIKWVLCKFLTKIRSRK